MEILDAVFEFQLPGLLVDASMVGSRLAVGDSDCWIQFPSDDGHDPLFYSESPTAGFNLADGNKVCVVVKAVLIGFPVEVCFTASDYRPKAVQAVLQSKLPRAREVFLNFAELLRIERNSEWLESRTKISEGDHVASGVLTKNGTRLDFGSLILQPLVVRLSRDSLKREEAVGLLARVDRGVAPPLWDVFLADANSATDLKHAVLLAAIACEVAVKTTLQERSNADQAPLIDLMLNHPRDVSLAAANLFDEPCRLILGRSLREDDKALFVEMSHLFEDRNKIAHRGLAKLRDDASLQREVSSASAAIDWLRNEDLPTE